ncbi:MAG: siderophore-interacting protein [Pseudomonadota bacterium]
MDHGALLSVAPEKAFEALGAVATQNGFDVDRGEAWMIINAPLGRVAMRAKGQGTDVAFAAETPAKLQLLKDLYAQRFTTLGLDDGIEWRAPELGSPPNLHLGHIESLTQISPNFTRLRLIGDYSAFEKPGAGLHFRPLFGPEGVGWPYLDERGLTTWPGGPGDWHRPPYTVRKQGDGWIDVDIVLHDGGRVTDWTKRAQPGEEFAVMGPSGSNLPEASWLGLFGDETALPVIMRILEAAPAGTQGVAYLALRDAADMQELPDTDIEVRRVDMADRGALLWALRATDIPAGDRHIFFAAERSQAGEAREVYRELGISSADAKAASYWTQQ